jgi:hypothetical protein
MSDVLLNYAFKISVNIPTPVVDISYLRGLAVAVKPKSAVEAGVYHITNPADIANYTDNTEAAQAFSGGLSSLYLIVADDLDDIADTLANLTNEIYTLAITSDFTVTEAIGADYGAYDGVIAVSGGSKADSEAFICLRPGKNVAFPDSNASNMLFAFGSFLSGTSWKNKQYLSLPFPSTVTTVGQADDLFNSRISFAITSPQYGNRLSFFGNQDAIIAPYVLKEIELLIQSRSVQYISLNNPTYTITEAALLQNDLQKVIDPYIENGTINSGNVLITLENDNFVASGKITIEKPRALWRVFAELYVQ